MIIRFSNKTEKEGFVVADKIVMDMNILREVVRHEDTVVFYDMDSAFSSLSEVVSFIEEMMEKSIFVIFEKEQMNFTSMNDEKCASTMKMLKTFASFVGCKKNNNISENDIINTVLSFYKENSERFEWNDATINLDERIGYRRICRGFVEYYMRPDEFKSYFVNTSVTSKMLYNALKSVDALIYETGRNDTYRRFSDGHKRYIGIRIRSENNTKDTSNNSRSNGKFVPSWAKYIQNEELREKMFPSSKETVKPSIKEFKDKTSKEEVKTIISNEIREEIIELAFGGMDAYELSKTFNIEIRTIKNILNGFA